MNVMSKIYLVGLPGSGKTTLGTALASALNLPFVDLDAEIEKQEGEAVPDIFSSKGEDHFRQVESRVLREWAGSSQSFVMGTGGGAPCFYNGMGIINSSGLSIFLDEPVDEILRRLEAFSNRPLLAAEDAQQKKLKLENLRNTRLAIYRQASITLQNPTVQRVQEALTLIRK
jgi:shikimate kinase